MFFKFTLNDMASTASFTLSCYSKENGFMEGNTVKGDNQVMNNHLGDLASNLLKAAQLFKKGNSDRIHGQSNLNITLWRFGLL